MGRSTLVAALLLVLGGAAAAPAQDRGGGGGQGKVIPVAAPPPAAEETRANEGPTCLEWLCGECGPVTAGDPKVNPDFWQQTWGIAGFDVYPVGSKMAPNGVPYNPLFSLDLLLNIALTRDREVYLFSNARFWGQKAADGITNPTQGALDFSKRQFDLDGGVAWNFYGPFEARAWVYSYNNLNRGTTLDKPFGFNDGFALACRYYLPSTDFDRGLYRYLALGYYPTKEMVGADGQLFEPGFFASAYLAYDFIPERFYVYANIDYISKRPFGAKLLLADPGVALRPFQRLPNLEFRLGAASTIDLEVAFTRTLFYGNVRIVW